MTADTINIWCRILRRSASGAAIQIDDGARHWLPVSQLPHIPDESHWDRPVCLPVPEWMAKEKGLI